MFAPHRLKSAGLQVRLLFPSLRLRVAAPAPAFSPTFLLQPTHSCMILSCNLIAEGYRVMARLIMSPKMHSINTGTNRSLFVFVGSKHGIESTNHYTEPSWSMFT
ncbi:hypothetical protein BJX61DRAFT_229941 [Aspergillus egyptiacus]|nr:hypothetical protein BJX61DRAFT_229941 [Aspergillus egyptiacus]